MLGALLAALVLNLGFTAQESRCVCEHGKPMPAGHGHHGQQQRLSQHQDHAPAIPLCCQALTSCSVTITASQATAPIVNPIAHGQPGLATDVWGQSRAPTPDTPPPRA